LINLIENAVKFTEKGYVKMKIGMEHKDGKSFIRFDVEDTGIGIPADQTGKIFESFVRLDATASRKYGGAGLGLTITNQLAKLFGGQLTVTSELGQGAVFTLMMPTNIDIDSYTHIEVEQASHEAATIEPARFSGKVLVAEDVITNQKLMNHLLGKMGLEVVTVDDGNKAVQKAVSQSFDMIFMDIQMPNMNGYEATQAIRKQGIKTPIIALTAYAMPGDDHKCIEAGCDDYLSKPLMYTKLVKTIFKYLGGATSTENADLAEKSDSSKDNRKDVDMVKNTDEVVVDWTKVTAGGLDEQIIKEVLPTYLEESKKHLQGLVSAVDTSNTKEVKLHAHAMKGAGRNLGIVRLSEVAGQLETMATQGDLSQAQELLKKVTDEFDKFEKFVSRPDWIEIAKGKAALETRA
jgi:two-component system, sensor histidine kinase